MLLKKHLTRIVILCLVIVGSVKTLKAAYYQDTLFPIGLSGLGLTKSGTYPNNDNNCPYNTKGWEWNEDPKREDELIYTLGVNCIGCEDAWQNILIDFAEERTGNTYLEEVLTYLADERADTNCYDTVYLITATYGAAPKRFDKNIIFKYTEANL